MYGLSEWLLLIWVALARLGRNDGKGMIMKRKDDNLGKNFSANELTLLIGFGWFCAEDF